MIVLPNPDIDAMPPLSLLMSFVAGVTPPGQVPQVKNPGARLEWGRDRAPDAPSPAWRAWREAVPIECLSARLLLCPVSLGTHFPVSFVSWLLGLPEDRRAGDGAPSAAGDVPSRCLVSFRTAPPLQSPGTPDTQPHHIVSPAIGASVSSCCGCLPVASTSCLVSQLLCHLCDHFHILNVVYFKYLE